MRDLIFIFYMYVTGLAIASVGVALHGKSYEIEEKQRLDKTCQKFDSESVWQPAEQWQTAGCFKRDSEGNWRRVYR
jgi:hypothetical protein